MSENAGRVEIETGTEDVLAWIDSGVGVVSLNRPTRRNALSDPMIAGVSRVLGEFAEDSRVRVLMITGEGGGFCSGGDVKAMNDRHSGSNSEPTTAVSRVARLRRAQSRFALALFEFPKPVVAALDGAAAGAGLSIALAADIRIGSPRAIMVPAFVDIGASGDFGGSWLLTQLVGPAKAKELYFWSPRLEAGDALELGLLNRLLDDGDFGEAAHSYCADLARRAPIALSYMKANVNRALGCDFRAALEAEAAAMVTSMDTKDHKEAVKAFVEKRTPTFDGA